jgi:hypothetical protein
MERLSVAFPFEGADGSYPLLGIVDVARTSRTSHVSSSYKRLTPEVLAPPHIVVAKVQVISWDIPGQELFWTVPCSSEIPLDFICGHMLSEAIASDAAPGHAR